MNAAAIGLAGSASLIGDGHATSDLDVLKDDRGAGSNIKHAIERELIDDGSVGAGRSLANDRQRAGGVGVVELALRQRVDARERTMVLVPAAALACGSLAQAARGAIGSGCRGGVGAAGGDSPTTGWLANCCR